MKNGRQYKDVSYYDHGKMVWNEFRRCIAGECNKELPKVVQDNLSYITANLLPMSTIKTYCEMHDCGKAFCTDDNYQEHAKVSGDIWKQLKGDPVVEVLIRSDMLLHKGTVEELEEYLRSYPKEYAFTLALVALAEIRANAEMFGGTDTRSYKIKYKKVTQRIKRILKYYPDGEHKTFYVFVDNTMSPVYQAIQGGHALQQAAKKWECGVSSIIYFPYNPKKKEKLIEYLVGQSIDFVTFHEPDIGNELTSICTEPLDRAHPSMKKFMLLR